MSTLDYKYLNPDERVRLWLAATARGDKVERQKVLDTARRSNVTVRERAVQVQLDILFDAAAALRMAVARPLEIARLLSGLLAPTSFWPDDLDETEWPRPSVLNQYLEGIADRSIWNGPVSLVDTDDTTFALSLEVAEQATAAVIQATDAALCQGLLGAHFRARGIIQGIRQWCEIEQFSADDFLTWYCHDLLDELSQQELVVFQARERLASFRRDQVWSSRHPGEGSDLEDFDELESRIAMIHKEIWHEVFPLKSHR
jgi:hypothetical protein